MNIEFVEKATIDTLASFHQGWKRLDCLAACARINILSMIQTAGSGHIGSSFSSLEVFLYLYITKRGDDSRTVIFSSKGHDAPALYATLHLVGELPDEALRTFRQLGGLPGHPDIHTPGVVTNTGSLGMGISKAKGMALANRIRCLHGFEFYVILGDGELQEGQIWESLQFAANAGLHEITAIVDANRYQSDRRVEETSPNGDIGSKFAAFGWHVETCDGNDFASIDRAISSAQRITDRPKVVIAYTVKGKGVSFMEAPASTEARGLYNYHSGAPSSDDYLRAQVELIKRLTSYDESGVLSKKTNLRALLEDQKKAAAHPYAFSPNPATSLVSTYEDCLVELGRTDPKLVVFSADLVKDCGLLRFEKEFPHRFVECGIAEQDMVSMAGGLALREFTPIVHSFACFLTARANEQIYNNATEQTRIVYAGMLAGLLPAGPGHSHQSIRDISLMRSVPNMIVVEPSLHTDVKPLVQFCTQVYQGPSYIRFSSIPHALDSKIELGPCPDEPIQIGVGKTIVRGDDAVLFCYGPETLTQALEARRSLASNGFSLEVVVTPWLNRISRTWLEGYAHRFATMFVVDNHYIDGGLFETVSAELIKWDRGRSVRLVQIAIERLPMCGRNADVLEAHNLDGKSIAKIIATATGALDEN